LKRYEAMFLFDNTAVHEWPDMEAEVRRLFERIGAESQVCLKFDERKLAYEIKGRKRGTYVLTYFDADPRRIADLERDARLSELILRALVLRADKLTEQRLAELKDHAPEQALQPLSSEGRRETASKARADTAERKRDAGGPQPEPAQAGAAAADAPAATEQTAAAPQPAPGAAPAGPVADDKPVDE
jgi:small subunit ribosomal protein S6